jgi:peptidoglycan/xylan/chitin deacetylase (PgdA/CDA1 family)
MKRGKCWVFLVMIFFFAACTNDQKELKKADNKPGETGAVSKDTLANTTTAIADAATILARKQVPILCYHQLTDSKARRDIIVPINVFKDHMKVLHDSGYHTILPDQLYEYLTKGTPLPDKPVMLTYDDTDMDHYTVAAPEMKKYGFKGVFFIMTVSMSRPPHYMSREQIKELSAEGHVIASHTWNHQKVPSYVSEEDWATQVDKPKRQIEELTGKPSPYFAFPYGLWNKEAIPELKKHGIKASFILSTKRDENDPLYTIRRMIGSGLWSGEAMLRSMKATFK